MCGLYGVLSYGNKVKDMAEITEALAVEVRSEVQTQPELHITKTVNLLYLRKVRVHMK